MHLIAEEGRGGETGRQTPDSGDAWNFGSKSPMWESEGEAWYEDKAFLQVILERTMCAAIRCTSSGGMGLVTSS